MRKYICAILAIVMLTMPLSACGNLSIGVGNYEFKIVHICDHSGNCTDVEIENWHESNTGVEIKMKDGNSLFLSEGTYIMCEDYCPICGRK